MNTETLAEVLHQYAWAVGSPIDAATVMAAAASGDLDHLDIDRTSAAFLALLEVGFSEDPELLEMVLTARALTNDGPWWVVAYAEQ